MGTIKLYSTYLGIIPITIILAASIVSLVLIDFLNFTAQGQGNLTAQQKAAICNPNNPKLKFVNSTESKICGIPPTPKNTTSTTANTTTGAETSS